MSKPFDSFPGRHTRLFLLETDDAPSELTIYVQSLLPGDGVPPDDWVNVVDGITADHTATLSRSRVVCLLVPRMDSLERSQESDEVG